MKKSAAVISTLCLLGNASLALADTPIMNIDYPQPAATLSGVATIYGWAVSNPGIAEVRMSIDDSTPVPLGFGGMRADVQAVYPGYPDSYLSGFASVINTRHLNNGVHTLTITATNEVGEQESTSVLFSVSNSTGPSNPFAFEIDLRGATVTVTGKNSLFIEGAVLNGQSANTTLQFDESAHQFTMTSFREDEDGDGYFDDDLDQDGYHDDDLDRDGFHDDDSDRDGYHDDDPLDDDHGAGDDDSEDDSSDDNGSGDDDGSDDSGSGDDDGSDDRGSGDDDGSDDSGSGDDDGSDDSGSGDDGSDDSGSGDDGGSDDSGSGDDDGPDDNGSGDDDGADDLS